ncbi:outer membrane beta-barrel protein [uncultured Bacteroides sp.]|uniref:OmpP1/FadL family transporter n=1 Tax=uncultured Bacteroides sp. TaxID=162156 RepID=UPI0027DDDEBB|nr:outer membrane beta-barrel protein [uncultured Bacteroides sp.]
MRKISLIGFVMLIVSIPTFAGGLLTNTNQHAAFLRMLSRGATIEIDGALSNPAGLAFLPNDGFHMGLSIQSAFQTRNIDASFMRYTGLDLSNPAAPVPTVSDQPYSKYYKGKAAAPVIPSVFAAYKKGDWTISGFFGITGGGGKASFDDGLPMFESLAMAGIFQSSVEKYKETQGQSPIVTPNMFDINSAMDGKQYIYSLQLGLSYKVNDWLSVFAGGRMNYFTGGYEGYLDAKLKENYGGKNLMNLALDCDQTGWGLTPVIGVDAKFGKFNIGAKYEFKTNLNIENNTKKNTDENGALAAFKHGVNTPNDIPSMLSVAAAYEILPVLRASVEYHFYDDKKAGMADGKQKYLTKGTNEYLMGIEWDVIKRLTLSCGGQITDYGLSDNFQSDTSFSCDSYTLGVGAKVVLSERANLNVGYMWTTYEDYTKKFSNYNGTGLPGTNVYSRTNKVFGVSLDYRF